MGEYKSILIATTDNELFFAFEEAFLEFDVELSQVTSYCDAIEELQNGLYDLLITDYFLKSGSQIEEASDVSNWEVDTINHDLEIVGYYRPALIWLRNLIYKMDKKKLFPLGRRLSIEADLLPIKTVLLLPYSHIYSEESMGIERYFSLYRDRFYSCNGDVHDIAFNVVERIIKFKLVDLELVHWPRMRGFFIIRKSLKKIVVLPEKNHIRDEIYFTS